MNMYNGTNNSNRRNNNNQRRNNSRGGSGKSNNRNGQNRTRNFDDENISPQQKRHFMNKRDTHLSRAKELRAAGDRVEAENEFQHAEHYIRMIKIADDQQQKYLDRKAAERPQNAEGNPEGNSENPAENNGELSSSAENQDPHTGVVNYAELQSSNDREELMVSEGAPVDEASQLSNESSRPRNQRRQKRPMPNKDAAQASEDNIGNLAAEPTSNAAPEIAELPFMQPIPLAAEEK